KSVLRKMRKNNLSTLFVLDKDHRVIGIVNVGDVAKNINKEKNIISDIVDTDIVKVKLDTPATELFALIENSKYPLAVVDDDDHLKGVIIKGSLISMLSKEVSTSGD
ncbi:MAG: CBS domain-containing protein, partial [Deferribacterota bacterium]|nr:CBS domain-containing protein [Deferribacterota bacterium]